jgi:hypothetical protein
MMMKISDFQKYIALYGADLSCWPRHEIRPALDLIQRDPEAGKMFAAAEKLDQMLRYYPAVPVDMNALSDKIIRRVKYGKSAAAAKPVTVNPAYLFVPGGGLIVAAILGFMIGFNTQTTKETMTLDLPLYMQDQIISDSPEAS